MPSRLAKIRCAYCGGAAASRPVDYYACCALCYDRDLIARSRRQRARNRELIERAQDTIKRAGAILRKYG